MSHTDQVFNNKLSTSDDLDILTDIVRQLTERLDKLESEQKKMPSADKTAKQSAASQTDQGTIGFINTSASTPTVLPEKVLVEEAVHSQTIPKIYDLKLSQENDEILEEMPQ